MTKCNMEDDKLPNDNVFPEWDRLPDEIWLSVFKHLPHSYILFVIRKVCKVFRNLSLEPELWRYINMSVLKEQTTVNFLPIEGGQPLEDNEEFAELNNLLKSVGHLSNSDMFYPLLKYVGGSIEKLEFSRYADDFVFGEDEQKMVMQCKRLKHFDVSFCESNINFKVLSDICLHCSNLQVLILDSCKEIDDDGVNALNALHQLEYLDVSHCALITDLGFSYLAEMPSKLIHFKSDGVLHISDNGIALLVSGQPRLKTLVLDGEDLTDFSIALIANNLPQLHHLFVSFCEHFTKRTFLELHGRLWLRSLSLRKLESDQITNDVIQQLFEHKCLQYLTVLQISDCLCIEDSTLLAVAARCSNLQSITFQWCPELTDNAIEAIIQSCRNLQEIILVGGKSLKGRWLKDIEKFLPSLRSLDLSFCNLILDQDVYDLVKRKQDLVAYTYYHEKVDHVTVPGEIISLPSKSILQENICAGSLGANVDF